MTLRRALVTACFLLSGATSLVFQVLWVRMLGLVVGHSALAIATVVATFMAGLGIGARLAGGLAQRTKRPLALYGALEAGIGAFALCTPSIFAALASTSMGGGLLSVPLAAAVLLPPTICMGATLPLLTRWYARDEATLGRDMGWLYAVNTTGAVAGAALAGFALLPHLGQPMTLHLAAGIDVGVGLLAMVLGRHAIQAMPRSLPDPASSAPSPPQDRVVLFAFGLSGTAAMICQVAWTRCFELFAGSTTYAFSLIVSAFILGLAVGGHVAAQVVDRIRDRRGLLAGVLLGVALVSALLIPVLGELPLLLLEPLAAVDGFRATQTLVFSVLLGIVLLPTSLLGAVYPIATRLLAPDPATAPEAVGRAYAANTAGAVLGSLGTGLVLLPLLGLQDSLWVASTLFALGAGLLLMDRNRLALVLPALLAFGALATPGWNPRHMNLAPHIYGKDLVANPASLAQMRDSGSVVMHREGRGATVTVLQRPDGARVLRINGKTDASTHEDRMTQAWIGRLPAVLAARATDVFVLGLGSGMSLAPLLERSDLQRLEVAELLPEVAQAAHAFSPLVGAPLEDPRTHLRVGDGRHLLAHQPGAWDIVVTQPTNLFVSGMSTLFTVEAFEIVRRGLRPDGLAVVWLQGYLLPDEDFRTIVRTFCSVFPDAVLFSAQPHDFALVASRGPLDLDAATLEGRIGATAQGRGARWTGLRELVDLQRHYLLGSASLRDFAGPGRVQRDEDPFLEFTAPRGLYGAAGLFSSGPLLARRELLPATGATPEQAAAIAMRLLDQLTTDRALVAGNGDAVAAAAARDPGNGYLHERLARVLWQQGGQALEAGDATTAERLAALSSVHNPTALPPRQLRAVALHLLGRTDEAKELLRRSAEEEAFNPYAALVLADFLARVGDAEGAQVALEDARRLDPELPELQGR